MMDALQLVNHLHRGGAFAYFWRLQGHRSEWHAVGSLRELPIGADVYWGVHPTTAIPPTNTRGEKTPPSGVRAQIPYVACVNCFFAELDAKDYGGSKDLCRTYIDERLFLSPSVVIDSGGGFHLYWLLAEPVMLVDGVIRGRIDKLQKQLVAIVGGDDGAKDLCRVLRVVGTMNGKYKPARKVTMVDGNGYLFDLPEIAELIEFHAPISAPLPDRTFDREVKGSGAQSAATLARFMQQQPEGKRNSGLYWAANRAKDDGLSQAEAESLLVQPAMHAGLSDKEAQRTIQSAYGMRSSKAAVSNVK